MIADNEIGEALEWVANCNGRNVVDCIGCPLAEFYPCCEEKALEFALDLINRQKAEIEELAYKLECLLCHATGGKLSKYTYPLGTMERYVNDTIQEYCDEAIEEAKAEARKEFVEELIHKIANTPTTFPSTYFPYRDGIKYREAEIIAMIKELAGENND